MTLTPIFNKSILSGKFPDDLKISIISPIYKSGNKTESTNYRTISVLSVVAKVLEAIISQQLSFPLSQKFWKQLSPSSFLIIWK